MLRYRLTLRATTQQADRLIYASVNGRLVVRPHLVGRAAAQNDR